MYVTFPDGEALQSIIKGYERRLGFPNCDGAIDGSYIPIIVPKYSHRQQAIECNEMNLLNYFSGSPTLSFSSYCIGAAFL